MKQNEYTPDERQRALTEAAQGIIIEGQAIVDRLNEGIDLISGAAIILDAEDKCGLNALYAKRIIDRANDLIYDVKAYMDGDNWKQIGIKVVYEPDRQPTKQRAELV